MTDYRALCAEALNMLDAYDNGKRVSWETWKGRARAAMAEPVTEGPSVEEVEDLCEEHCFNVEGYESIECLQGLINDALARWGNHSADASKMVGQPAPPAEGEVAELVAWLRMQGEAQKPGPNSLLSDRTKKEHYAVGMMLTRAADLLEQRHPAPPAEGEVTELVEWLKLTAEGKPRLSDEGYARLTRAADLLERQAAPVPVPAGEVAELVVQLRGCADDHFGATSRMFTRAADLLEQRHPTPVPAGMIPVEYWDIDSGARIVSEPSEEEAGGCWIVLNSRYVNPLTEFPTAKAAWDALQQATALPLPQGEVE